MGQTNIYASLILHIKELKRKKWNSSNKAEIDQENQPEKNPE